MDLAGAVRTTHLVGREEELTRVADLAGRLLTGRGAVIVLVGEHGIGKSSLLREAIALTGRLVPGVRGTHIPSGVFDEDSVSELATTIARGLPFSTGRATELVERAAGDGSLGLNDPAFLRAALDLAQEISSDRPLLVTADDLPLHDEQLFAAFTALATGVTSMPILVVVTAERLPNRIGSTPAGSLWVHHVEPLTDRAAARTVLATNGPHVPYSVAFTLGGRLAGNPGDINEVCALLSDAQLTGVEPLPQHLPGTPSSDAKYRPWWRSLSEDHRMLVVCAAVSVSGSAETVESASGLTLGDVVGPTGRPALRRMDGRISFTDRRLASAVLALAPMQQIRRAHERLADSSPTEGLDRHWHTVLAGRSPTPEQRDAMLDGVGTALQQGDLDRALRLADDCASRLALTDDHRARLALLGGIAALHAGFPALAARRLAEAVAAATDAPTLRHAVVPFVHALCQRDRAVPRDSIAYAVAQLLDHGDTAGAVSLACFAARLCLDRQDLPAARRYLQHADELAHGGGGAGAEPAELALTRAAVTGTHLDRGALPPALTSLVSSPAATDVLTWDLLLGYVAMLVRGDRPQEARAALSDLGFRARRFADGWVAGCVALLGLRLHLMTWEVHRAREIVKASATTVPLHVCQGPEGMCLVAATLLLRGDEDADLWVAAAEHLVHHGPTSPPALTALSAVQGWRCALRGDHAGAVRHLTESLQHDTLRGVDLATAHVELALSGLRTGQPRYLDEAAVAVRTLVDGPPSTWAGDFLPLTLRLLEVRGEATVAVVHDVVASAGRLANAGHEGKLLELAAARLALLTVEGHARAAAELGAPALPTNRDEHRRALLVRASGRYRACGAVAQAAVIDDELTAPVPDPAAETPGPRRSSLTTEERRIAGLVYRGASNKEVARAMFISVRTVELRLTNIYRKLGVRSRSELRDLPDSPDPE